MKLKELFTSIYSLIILLLVILGIDSVLMYLNNQKMVQSNITSSLSFQIADELRQSSDDLTKYCQMYVVTGDDTWENKYWQTLDIRNGKKPRPDGHTIALQDTMRKLGFTRIELDKLKESEQNSNSLVTTEKTAFHAVKGLFADSSGNFTIHRTPDREMARRIMFDKKYQHDKSVIMKPISEFIDMVKQRTQKDVAKYTRLSYWFLSIALALIILILLISIFSFSLIKTKIIDQLIELKMAKTKVEKSEEFLKNQNEILDKKVEEHTAELKDYKYALDIAALVSITGADDTFTFVNENFCNACKYSAEELLGQSWSMIASGVQPPEYFSELQITLQQGKPYRGEFCNKAKDGTLYWLDTTVIPFLDRHGKIYQHLSINQDITERKLTEEKLKKSEGMNRAMIENMSNGLVLLDSNWSYVYQSPSVERITGYSFKDRKTKTASELIFPDDLKLVQETMEQAMAHPNQPINYQTRIIHKSGNIVWINGSIVNLLNNPDVGAILVNYSDITERIEAEEKIKDSEQLIKKITSQVPGNTYMFEIEPSGHTHILWMNRGNDAFNHKYELDDFVKHSETLGKVIYDDDKVKFNHVMKQAYQTQSSISFQYRIIANGQIKWRWMQAVPERDKNGKMVWYAATSDIDPLVDYIGSIEQIIFDIGHVIRRPISSMIGMTKLIIDHKLSEEEIKEISLKLYEISEEMDQFINELNFVYNEKRQKAKFNIDISPLIDKRKSLFK